MMADRIGCRWVGFNLVVLSAACLAATVRGTDSPGPITWRSGDRVVLLGSSFVERLQRDGYFELSLTTAFPQLDLTFRNLGWSGDTVWGDSRAVFGGRAEGFQRLVSDTLAAQPTVLVIVYGHNEAFAGPGGLEEFRVGLLSLLDALAPAGARTVLVAPPKAMAMPPPLPAVDAYNRNLAAYRDAIREVAANRGLHFVDWYDLDARPSNLRDLPPITEDGRLLTTAGHWALATRMAQSFGVPDDRFTMVADVTRQKTETTGFDLAESVLAPTEVSLIGTPRALPPPMLPLSNAQSAALNQPGRHRPFANLRVTGLDPGMYEVLVNGERQFSASAPALAAGVDLQVSPDSGRVLQLQRLIQAKDEWYFHRYRPQNETYLFLFRKHEQGNNAQEIPQFDRYVAAKEQEIAEIRRPRPLTIQVKK